MKHHPAVEAFSGYRGPKAANEIVDWLGVRYDTAWWDLYPKTQAAWVEVPPPAFEDEYFEWIALLEAVRTSRDRFVMLDLGAGFARWGMRGAIAARQKGLPSLIRYVEAEPIHVQQIHEALDLNRLTEGAEVFAAPVGYSAEPVPFIIGFEGHHAKNWHGQTIWPEAVEPTDETYCGHPVHAGVSGYRHILLKPQPLEALAEGLELIDLIDMDIQAGERDLVANSMPLLNERVRIVHISTHTSEIEAFTRERFTAEGWRNMDCDFTVHGLNETPYGTMQFLDGAQTWANPRL